MKENHTNNFQEAQYYWIKYKSWLFLNTAFQIVLKLPISSRLKDFASSDWL